MGRDIDWTNTGSATTIPGGTAMAVLASGKMCPRLTIPGSETAVGFLIASADMNDESGRAGHGLIIGGVVFENLIADYVDAAWATIKAELPTTFQFVTYGDDRT
jgi:hypothetical protein